MSSKHWGALALLGGLLLAALPTMAHHSVASEFDLNTKLTLKGTLVQMEYVNPHSYLHLEVTNKDGSKTEWTLLTTAASALRQKGLARAENGGLAPGMILEVTAAPAKNGKNFGYVRTITMPDGHVVTIWYGDPNGN